MACTYRGRFNIGLVKIEGLGRIRLFCKVTEILMIDDEKICTFS